jgi:hypothetical protein
MIDPSVTDDRAAYVCSLIAVRCPELDSVDLALITQPATTTTEMLPVEIGSDLMAVLEAMEAKLDRLAEAMGANKDEDDATGQPARQADQ